MIAEVEATSPRASGAAAGDNVDPRVVRSRAVILDAVLDELSEVGYGAMSIEGVARRAGVGKATIYRHWSGKLDLVGDAVSMLKQSVRPPATGDHRERIVGYVSALATTVADSRFSACMPAIVDAAERDEAVREFHHRTSADRRRLFVGMLDDARDDGNLSAVVDTNLLGELIVGPIFLRRLMTADPFPVDRVAELVAMVLDPHWID